MRCRLNDLAFIVRSTRGYEGLIVEVVAFVGYAEFVNGSSSPDCWAVRCSSLPRDPLADFSFGADAVFPDAWLRPIRDPGVGAVDETLVRMPRTQPERLMASGVSPHEWMGGA